MSGGACGTVAPATVLALFVCASGCALRSGDTTAPRAPSPVAHANMSAVRPIERRTSARALEQIDPALAAALQALTARPTAATERRVAGGYLERGVLDTAFDHFSSALRIDRADAVSYEGRARIWRTWGFIERALGEAHRAVFYAPQSASAHNTLGTILQAIGRLDDAARAYERALALDPAAAYAINNLCLVAFEQRAMMRAEALCRQALAVQPDFPQARANLARVVRRLESGE